MRQGEDYKRAFPKLPSGKVLTFKPVPDISQKSVSKKIAFVGKTSIENKKLQPTVKEASIKNHNYKFVIPFVVGALTLLIGYKQFTSNEDLGDQYYSAVISYRDFANVANATYSQEQFRAESETPKKEFKIISRSDEIKSSPTSIKIERPKVQTSKVSTQVRYSMKKVEEGIKNKNIVVPSVAKESKKVLSIIKGYGKKNVDSVKLAHNIVVESRKANYDPLFVAAVIKSESAFNSMAKSNVGALGLMQIMPGTGNFIHSKFKQFEGAEKKFLTDPNYNIQLGIAYLKYLDDLFQGNRVMTLIAYNWGPGHVEKTMRGEKKGVPRPVMNYALKILSDHSKWRRDLYQDDSLA